MTVQHFLGLDEDGGMLDTIRDLWPSWAAEDERLAVMDFDAIRTEFSTGEGIEPILTALAFRASRHGLDDPMAAYAIAWVMLPAMARLSAKLAKFTPDHDELVASHLWSQIREVSLTRKVIIVGIRRAVEDAVIGDVIGTRRPDRIGADRAWVDVVLGPDWLMNGDVENVRHGNARNRHTSPVPIADLDGSALADPQVELEKVLTAGVDMGVIEAEAADLIRELVTHMPEKSPAGIRGTSGGITGRPAIDAVAARRGVGGTTLRRRAAAAMAALAANSDVVGVA